MVEGTAPVVPTQKKFDFIGRHLCLDFCNTVGGKRGGVTREYLNSYADFIVWCEQAALLSKVQARFLMEGAAKHPTEANEVYSRAVELREAIYKIFHALSEQRKHSKIELSKLYSELAQALGRLRIAATTDGFRWEWTHSEDALDDPLGPLARAAADLLTREADCGHVGQCQGETCGWLFIDSSKNHSRRWCDMRDCGNRAKVRRHRKRIANPKSELRNPETETH